VSQASSQLYFGVSLFFVYHGFDLVQFWCRSSFLGQWEFISVGAGLHFFTTGGANMLYTIKLYCAGLMAVLLMSAAGCSGAGFGLFATDTPMPTPTATASPTPTETLTPTPSPTPTSTPTPIPVIGIPFSGTDWAVTITDVSLTNADWLPSDQVLLVVSATFEKVQPEQEIEASSEEIIVITEDEEALTPLGVSFSSFAPVTEIVFTTEWVELGLLYAIDEARRGDEFRFVFQDVPPIPFRVEE
jgi:hypothetical protein